MSLPSNFQFSQGSLQDYVDCPRRFQLKYIEQLAWPAVEAEPALENENYLQQGAAFHRLVQQHLIGVSAEKLTPIAERDANLARWWENFLPSIKNLEGFENLPGLGHHPEFSLSAPIGEFRIVGKFDLLVNTDDKFIIYDWKTSRKQPKREWIAANLQTRVYPYLLVESGAYLNNGESIASSQIEMVYWFADYPAAPIKFPYNDQQYNEDRDYIISLIDEIKKLDESPAPMTENQKRCRFCVYRSLCNRGVEAGPFNELEDDAQGLGAQNPFDFYLDFEQIAEIEF
jgi:CRISPR/Cas system-associated exonuclease Cas4 (RecB family)